jgi:hypothetical protein
VGGSGWVGVLVVLQICVCDVCGRRFVSRAAWSTMRRRAVGEVFWFLVRGGEGTRCLLFPDIRMRWLGSERRGSEQVPKKLTFSLSCHTGAVVVVLVVVVDVRKWTAPTSPQKNLQKKDERYSRLAVLGPGRLLVLRLLCRR